MIVLVFCCIVKYLRAVPRIVNPVLSIVVVADESLLWYVFEIRPVGHVVGYLPNSGTKCHNFPKVLIIKVLTLLGCKNDPSSSIFRSATIRPSSYRMLPYSVGYRIWCLTLRLEDGLKFMQTVSETVTILIGAVECMAGLKLNFYDSRWLDRSENKLCM